MLIILRWGNADIDSHNIFLNFKVNCYLPDDEIASVPVGRGRAAPDPNAAAVAGTAGAGGAAGTGAGAAPRAGGSGTARGARPRCG